MTDRRFVVTFFPDITGKDLTEKEMSLDELRDLVLTTTARQKSALPLLKLANFGIERNPESQSLRHNGNVESISGAETDYDAMVVSFDRAVELLSQAGLKGLVYTSPSYAPSAPKWRVVAPTSKDLPPSERKKLVGRINGIFNGALAGESFTLSQAYYLGSVNGNPDHRAVITEGDYIDLRDDLDATARGKKNSANLDTAQPQREGPRTDKQADPDLVYAAMAVIPNDDAEWFERNDLGMACWNATNGHQRGFEAYDMWCRKSPTKYDAEKVRARWQHYFTSPPTEIGAGTIFRSADEAQFGWRALVGLPIEQITEFLRLAKLTVVQYDTERKEAADLLGIRVSTLDGIVGRLCSRMTLNDDDGKQGTRQEFAVFDPWPDAVDGATLIDDMVKAIRKHVILSEHQALAVALWVILTHAFELADHYATASDQEPGDALRETTLLNVIAPMVPKALWTENISTAALFRIIEMQQPTLLIDEADNFLKTPDGQGQ